MFGRQGHNNSNSSNLVEFRAGRMNMIGRMVHPDTRKGLVYLTQSDDGLMHFCWKDRTSGKVEDDLIVFPDEYDFQRVEQCKTGRVYVLKFKTSTRRMFFWMQEPKTDKDEEHCRRVNELMNNPPSASSRGSGGGGSSNSEGGGDLQYMLNNISQQQLMQLFGGVGQMGGLSSLLGSMNRAGGENSRNSLPQRPQAITLVTPENSSSSSNATRTPSAPKSSSKSSKSNSIDDENETSNAAAVRSLNAIPNTEPILEITADPAKKTQTLSVHLPESYELDEEKNQRIKETVSSPEFEKALSSFAIALQSSTEPIVTKFELTPDAIAAAYAGNLKDFNKALENALPNDVQMVSIAKDAAGAESTSKGVEEQNTSPASPEHADNNKESTD